MSETRQLDPLPPPATVILLPPVKERTSWPAMVGLFLVGAAGGVLLTLLYSWTFS